MDTAELIQLVLRVLGTGLMLAALITSLFRRYQAIKDLDAVYSHEAPTAAMLHLAQTSVRGQTIRTVAYSLATTIVALPIFIESGEWAVFRLTILLGALAAFPFEERYQWIRRNELMRLLREAPDKPAHELSD